MSLASPRASLKVEWALLFALAVAAVAVGQHPRRGVDFRVYLTAAERFREGTDLYRVDDGAMPFKYAPVTAPLFLPFTALPPRAAVALWNLGSVLALAGVSVLTRRARPSAQEATPWPWAPVLATAVLLPAFALEFFYGQVDAVLLWLLVFAAVGAERGRVWGPGAAFAVACLLKPPAALLGLFLLWRKHWRVVGATALFGALLVLPTLGRYGWTGTVSQLGDWTRTLARTTPPWALGHNPQGLPTLLMSWVLPAESLPPPGAMSLAQAVALGLFIAALGWARPGPVVLLACCCLGVTLLSPLAWRANYVLAWPLIRAALEGRSRAEWTGVAFVAILGVTTSDAVLGAELARRVLLWRPFAVAYAALLIACLLRKQGSKTPGSAPSDTAVTRLPSGFLNARGS
jgi:hypothetical protein